MKKFNPINILNGNIPFPNLLEELLDYGNSMSNKLFEQKVFRVWMKCKRAGKHGLADKIKDKYPRCFEIKSDDVQAFALSIAANNKLKNEQTNRNL